MSSDSSTSEQWISRHEDLGHFEKVGYVGLGEAYNKWIYELRAEHFLRLARDLGISPSTRVLDVGLGNGFYIDLYQRLAVNDVSGLDLSPRSIQEAQDRFNRYAFLVHDVTKPIPSMFMQGGFDWVSAMDMLYHVVEDDLFAAAVRTCGNAVKPGGKFIVSDNFPVQTQPATSTQAFHSLRDYETELRPLGFKLVDLRPVFFISNGQVGAPGPAFRAARGGWRGVSRLLSKTLRTHEPTGEALGNALGFALTRADRWLQGQQVIQGFSTKVAVFERAS